MMPPIRVVKDELIPVRIREPKPGVYVVNFGENISGWVKLFVKGAAGTEVTLRYAEKAHEDGSLDRSNIDVHMIKTTPPQRFQTDRYILKGKGLETWEPSFEYNGFQYVEVTGFPGKPTIDSFRARFCHTAVEPVGGFASSNSTLGAIWDAGKRAYLSNLQSIPTDCPHREKNGWTRIWKTNKNPPASSPGSSPPAAGDMSGATALPGTPPISSSRGMSTSTPATSGF
jgi:alpha-L-rhamnosidase